MHKNNSLSKAHTSHSPSFQLPNRALGFGGKAGALSSRLPPAELLSPSNISSPIDSLHADPLFLTLKTSHQHDVNHTESARLRRQVFTLNLVTSRPNPKKIRRQDRLMGNSRLFSRPSQLKFYYLE